MIMMEESTKCGFEGQSRELQMFQEEVSLVLLSLQLMVFKSLEKMEDRRAFVLDTPD